MNSYNIFQSPETDGKKIFELRILNFEFCTLNRKPLNFEL